MHVVDPGETGAGADAPAATAAVDRVVAHAGSAGKITSWFAAKSSTASSNGSSAKRARPEEKKPGPPLPEGPPPSRAGKDGGRSTAASATITDDDDDFQTPAPGAGGADRVQCALCDH